MHVSRRTFLGTGSKLGLAAVFSSGIGAIAFGQTHSRRVGITVLKEGLGDTLSKITRVMFADNVETKFTFSLDGTKLADLTLTDVIEGEGTTGGECFLVRFRGPRSLTLKQDTYTITHGSLGEFQLLVVPGGWDKHGSGLHYVAVINRAYS